MADTVISRLVYGPGISQANTSPEVSIALQLPHQPRLSIFATFVKPSASNSISTSSNSVAQPIRRTKTQDAQTLKVLKQQ
jgi:hypothetical protein